MKYVNLKLTEKPKKASGGKIHYKLVLSLAFMILIIGGLMLKFGKGAKAVFDPVSIVANISGVGLKETDGRTNILLLGLDRRDTGVVTSLLTDTIIIASVGKVDGKTVLISVPRDLWIKDYDTKLNSLYAFGGAEKVLTTLRNVLGIPIHYYAVVDFDLFKETVDTLGGINVNIERAFDDYTYPIEGKENAPLEERYETLHFAQGETTMNGEIALKFVRSRHGNNDEGTDFARSRRQQKVIMAIKDKALSMDTLLNPTKLKGLFDTYAKNVDTNVDFNAVQGFYLLSKDLNLTSVKSIVLDDRSNSETGGLLYAPEDMTLYKNQYVLIPRSGDFSQIHAYIQRYVFGSE